MVAPAVVYPNVVNSSRVEIGLILFVARVFEHQEEGEGSTTECSFEYGEIFVSAASEVVGALYVESLLSACVMSWR